MKKVVALSIIILFAIANTDVQAQTTLNISGGAGFSIDHNGPVSKRDPSYMLSSTIGLFNGWVNTGLEFKNTRYRPMNDSMHLLNIASAEFVLSIGLPLHYGGGKSKDINHFAGTGMGFGFGPAWSSERYEHGVITGSMFIKISYGWVLADGFALSVYVRESYHEAWMQHTFPIWTTTSPVLGTVVTLGNFKK